MIHLFDIGNSRTKHARVNNGVMADPEIILSENIMAVLPTLANTEIEQVWFASSHQQMDAAKIHAALQEVFQCGVTQAVSLAQWNGLKNGYQDVEQLGVDRWLAMVALWQQQPKHFAVIDCGTCITYDAVDASGQHQGGLIAAGRPLLHQSLAHLLHTPITTFEQGKTHNQNTEHAIAAGGNINAIATVQYLVEAFYQRHAEVGEVFVTGGDAAFIAPQIKGAFSLVENLPLKGLLAIANSAKSD